MNKDETSPAPDQHVCDGGWACHFHDVKAVEQARRVIELTPAEIQSGYDRVKWAEGLIRQLPETHEGRNSWLLNYGA